MNIAESAIAHRKSLILGIVILAAAGLYAAFTLPSGIYPEVDFPRIAIIAEAGDLPTGNMLLSVTRPIEEAMSGVLGVYRVRSRTIRGGSELSVGFLPHTDMQLALQQVQAKVSEIRPLLPAETQLTVERLTPAVFPVLSFNLTGKGVSPADLRDAAQYDIRPLLSRISGVGQVRVLGDTVREIEVVVDSQKLLANHLTLEQIQDAIHAANTIEAVGRLSKDYKQFLILMSGEIKSIDIIGNIVVGTRQSGPDKAVSLVSLRDVAQIFEGTEDKLMLATGNGEPAAQINLTRQIGGSILRIEQQAIEKVKELEKILPANVHLSIVYDLAEFVRDSISSVRDAILIGWLLSVLILFFFLREWRSTLIAASSIPVTVIMTLFFMKQFNQTLNLMSLGGLAVAIGLVIDNAIVVVENIHRHLQRSAETGESKSEVIRTATQEIFGAVAGSTLTTVVVFLPLGLVEGVVGQFFAAFSITLSTAVLISLVLAFTLIPLLSEQFLREDFHRKKKGQSDLFLNRLIRVYHQMAQWALGHTKTVIATTVLCIGIGVLIYLHLGSGFLPTMDEGSFVLDYWMPSGTSLDESNRVIHQVEMILKTTPEISSFSRRTGAQLGLFATEQSSGDILVKLKKGRRRDAEEIMDDLRTQIESTQPALRIEFVQVLQDILGDLEGSPEPVEVKIFGDDPAVLQDRAELIARTESAIADVAGNMISYRESGVVEKKGWLVGEDSCDECQANADEGDIDLDEAFSDGSDCAPAHPRCTCDIVPRVSELPDDNE